MAITVRQVLWTFLGCLAMWLLLAQPGQLVHAAVVATPPCPEGSMPREFVELAAFGLPGEIPPGATVELDRVTVAPGEVLRPETTGYTAYYIESGTLKVQLQARRQQGFHLEHSWPCEPVSGVFSGGGTIPIDDEGWIHVAAGTALISEETPIGEIGNAGNDPLVLLQVTLRLPEIDPATGQPVGDELVTDCGDRERQKQRRERRHATPTP